MKLPNTFIGIILSAALVLVSCGNPPQRYMTITGYAQGGTYTVKFDISDASKGMRSNPEKIKVAIDSILSDIDNSLSGYNRNSLLSRFNAGEAVVPDSIFKDIYARSYVIWKETGGIVDVAAGPLFDIWGFGFKSGEFPTDQTISELLEECTMKNLPADINTLLEGKVPRPQLNYNAVAQGYSCDLVAEYLYSIGIKDMMVDIGEIFCDGLNPSGKPWTIGIDSPVDGNNVTGAQLQGIFRVPSGAHGVVTSGNYRKFYVRDGRKYAHTIDPRTGRPVTHNLLSATVVAPDGITADALATYCMVVGLEESKKFLSERSDLEGCLIYDENGEFRTWCSEGFTLEEF